MSITRESIDEYFKTHINGYFGFFDILGYKDLILKNDLETVVEVYNETLSDLAEKSILIEGKHDYAKISDQHPVRYFVFSDTIILYQDSSLSFPTMEIKGHSLLEVESLKIFMETVCYLLRLSFDRGIPIRGAISYGKYYATENGCFLGKPIVDAYNMEKSQMWSGAVICESVQDKMGGIRRHLMTELKKDRIKIPEEMSYLKKYSKPSDLGNRALIYAITPYLIHYKVPYSSKLSGQAVNVAFSWDDIFLEWFGLSSIPALFPEDDESIKEIVKAKFSAHNKSTDNDDVKTKIDNTSEFLIQLKHIQRKKHL